MGDAGGRGISTAQVPTPRLPSHAASHQDIPPELLLQISDGLRVWYWLHTLSVSVECMNSPDVNELAAVMFEEGFVSLQVTTPSPPHSAAACGDTVLCRC